MSAPRFLEGVRKRELVGNLAASDSARALEVARGIADPWYRCQSLAAVAWHIEDRKQFEKVIGEALTAAHEQDVPNRIVSVASWAVRAMVKRSDRRVGPEVSRLLDRIQSETNPVRQADALFYLFEAVFYIPQLRDSVLDALLHACEEMKSWKRPRILSDIALVLAIDDPNRADEIVELIGDRRKTRQTRHDIATGQWLGPHEFFPHYAKPVP